MFHDPSPTDPSPLWIWLDPTRRCNLVCGHCYTKHSHGHDDMSVEVLCAVLDNLLDEPDIAIAVAHLNWRGEPLMNPQFVELLRIASVRLADADLHWHTNGTLLRGDIVDAICATTAPHLIYVSIDGGHQASHDAHRGKGTFESALRGVRRLLDARDARRHWERAKYDHVYIVGTRPGWSMEFTAPGWVGECVWARPVRTRRGHVAWRSPGTRRGAGSTWSPIRHYQDSGSCPRSPSKKPISAPGSIAWRQR